jgi:hypothetical protein
MLSRVMSEIEMRAPGSLSALYEVQRPLPCRRVDAGGKDDDDAGLFVDEISGDPCMLVAEKIRRGCHHAVLRAEVLEW